MKKILFVLVASFSFSTAHAVTIDCTENPNLCARILNGITAPTSGFAGGCYFQNGVAIHCMMK